MALSEAEREKLNAKIAELSQEIPPGLPRLQWLQEHKMRLQRSAIDLEFMAYNMEIMRHQVDRLSVLLAMHQMQPGLHREQSMGGEGPQKGGPHPNGDPLNR